jgi:tRNA pseudouridine55 synthase
VLGILIVRKETGCTSHDVVNEIRHRFGLRRVGHAGTLDPEATGVLVVAVGPATRFLQYLPLEPKEYLGRFRFGVETSTYDIEGEVVAEKPVPADLPAAFEAIRSGFLGLIEQLPPMHSAVKVQGKPLYKYARQGKEVKREPRVVNIHELNVEGAGEDWLDVRIICSGGTYIRSLAHDSGQALGCCGHLAALRRERVGKFSMEDAHEMASVKPEHLMPLSEALEPMPMLLLNETQTHQVREGRPLFLSDPVEGPLVALKDPEGVVFSVARGGGNVLQPECVIPSEVTLEVSS